NMVNNGAGVSIVADMALNKELMTLFPNVQKLPLSPNIKRSISLAVKNKKQMSPITQAFIDIAQMV
ncbi:MAG: LysR family transcriptional regulator substrate-binding protein, partial [Acinetobacter sp.]|nr:LysR family transcriptional regulator substrate-binding protein [Acinetobacter sp.]